MYAPPPPPPYQMLGNQESNDTRPPPYPSSIPRYQSEHYGKRSKTGCGVRIICCCYCCFISQILVTVVAAVIFYFIYRPSYPDFTVHSFDLKDFSIQPNDLSLNTEIQVTIKAMNNNTGAIEFEYNRDGSSIELLYKNTNICSGKIPHFRQTVKTTNTVVIDLKGNIKGTSALFESLKENQKNGDIPLLVKVKAPVTILLWSMPILPFTALLNVTLVVDNLEPGKPVKIISSKYSLDKKLI